MDNTNNTAAIVNALIAIFAATPLAMADDFLTLAIKVTETGTFADTKTVGEAFDYMTDNNIITAEEIAANEAESLAQWEAWEAARKEAKRLAYGRAHIEAAQMAMARNGN